jgi:hypothetical protein
LGSFLCFRFYSSLFYRLYFPVSYNFGLLSLRAPYIFNAGPYHHIYSAVTGQPYKVTPWSRVLHEKLICPHVVKQFGVLHRPLTSPE